MGSKPTKTERKPAGPQPPRDSLPLWLARSLRVSLKRGTGPRYRQLGICQDPRFRNRPLLVGPEFYGRHLIWTGTTGSGKTYGAADQVVQAMAHGANVVVLDPHALMIRRILGGAADMVQQTGMVLIWPGGPSRMLWPWNPLWSDTGAPACSACWT